MDESKDAGRRNLTPQIQPQNDATAPRLHDVTVVPRHQCPALALRTRGRVVSASCCLRSRQLKIAFGFRIG